MTAVPIEVVDLPEWVESPQRLHDWMDEQRRAREIKFYAREVIRLAGELGWGGGVLIEDAIEWVRAVAVEDGLLEPRRARAGRPGFSPLERITVYGRDNFTCVTCRWRPVVPQQYDGSLTLYGVDTDGRTRYLTIDHAIALAKGGAHALGNFQTLCNRCNSAKGTR